MIDCTCTCGELLGTFHEDVKGSVILICPKCERSNSWQSSVDWGNIPSIPSNTTEDSDGSADDKAS